MLDEKLSKSAGKIVTGLAGIATAWACYETFREGPLALPISEWQASALFGGSYYPVVTILVLVLPFWLPVYGIAFGWDYATRQGMFRDEPVHFTADDPERPGHDDADMLS